MLTFVKEYWSWVHPCLKKRRSDTFEKLTRFHMTNSAREKYIKRARAWYAIVQGHTSNERSRWSTRRDAVDAWVAGNKSRLLAPK